MSKVNPILGNASLEEVKKGHSVMITVLQARQMKLNASLTFWKKQDYSQLLTHLLRTDDDSVFVDVLPFFTKRIAEDDKDRQKKISLGSCLELLPILERLLQKKYEMYICTSLDFLISMIKRWYFELRSMKTQKLEDDRNNSLSLPSVYLNLLSLQNRIQRLSMKPGNVGSKAKVVLEMLKQVQ